MATDRKMEARRHLEKALQLDPLLQQAVELLSRLYREEGERAKADGLAARYRSQMDSYPAR